MEKKVIDRFYHKHPLILTENVSDKKSPHCHGCGKPVANLEMAYVCTEQHCSNRIILQNKCGELPLQISHPKHPQHPLDLFDYRESNGDWCNICGRNMGVLGYGCSSSCYFDLHTTCVNTSLLEKKELQHPSHPHPLALMRKPAFSFLCDGCGAQDVDMAYICSTCEFMVHKSCASLPTILPIDDQYHHHHHPLSLVFSRQEERKYRYDCDLCDKHVDTTCWVYFCGDCRYFLHLKCVGSTTESVYNLTEDDDSGSNVIQFPLHAKDVSNKLIRPFVMREKSCVGNIPIPIPDPTRDSFLFNYHEHPLSLVSKSSHKDDEDDEGEELKICEVCVTPISSPPYYECTACTYSIHSICCFLPNTLHSSSSNPNSQLYGDCQDIPNKNHNFTLYATCKSKARNAISFWSCNLCDLPTNGIGYECEECGMKIDVKCASLPTTITHAFHPRHNKPLLLTRIPPQQQEDGTRDKFCRCCDSRFKIGYCCSDDDCDFALDVNCALLPKSIRKREWDRHPLLFTFDASLDHPSDFFCEFCEDKMYPKEWMYHCRECDVSFETYCLETGSGSYRNIKFGGRYKLDGIHPNHPLTFNYITLMRRCHLCDDDVYTYLGFECASCYYVVCEDCGRREFEKI